MIPHLGPPSRLRPARLPSIVYRDLLLRCPAAAVRPAGVWLHFRQWRPAATTRRAAAAAAPAVVAVRWPPPAPSWESRRWRTAATARCGGFRSLSHAVVVPSRRRSVPPRIAKGRQGSRCRVDVWSSGLLVFIFAHDPFLREAEVLHWRLYPRGDHPCPTTERHARPCALISSASPVAHRTHPSERFVSLASPPALFPLPDPPLPISSGNTIK